MATRTVKWLHPSIRMAGAGYGELVDLDEEAIAAYEKRGWCTSIPAEAEGSAKASEPSTEEAPDADGEDHGE